MKFNQKYNTVRLRIKFLKNLAQFCNFFPLKFNKFTDP